jgi:hypothetical protein
LISALHPLILLKIWYKHDCEGGTGNTYRTITSVYDRNKNFETFALKTYGRTSLHTHSFKLHREASGACRALNCRRLQAGKASQGFELHDPSAGNGFRPKEKKPGIWKGANSFIPHPASAAIAEKLC